MAYINPTITDFKNYFNRDFPYGSDLSTVQDNDITKAINEANAQINSALFSSQLSYTTGYLYLSAHLLCENIGNSSQGLQGKYEWLTNSKSVGNVSESYGIPEKILRDIYLATLVKTRYGAKYVAMIAPLLKGHFSTLHGATHA